MRYLLRESGRESDDGYSPRGLTPIEWPSGSGDDHKISPNAAPAPQGRSGEKS